MFDYASTYICIYIMAIQHMQGPVKKRYYNHRSSFVYEVYRHITSLSNYMWEIKKNLSTDPSLKREVVTKNTVSIKQG